MFAINLHRISSIAIGTALALGAAAATAAGAPAELRSSAALVPVPAAGQAVPTAPAGGLGTAAQPWICDAAQGFAPAVSTEPGNPDPILALDTTNAIHLPISPTTTPATCGQVAYDGKGTAYVTQAVVDTKVTPSVSRGVLRVPVDPQTGAITGPGTYIATTAGLDGNQPTGAALGPDGNLYVAFLKNGNIKRIVNPGIGTTQVVQSVGNTPQGHPGRALAFVGPDLFIGSVDAFSVILNAISPACTGGCNAVALTDGFAGVPHTGMAYDGAEHLYFAIAGNPLLPGSSQVWRLSLTSGQGLYQFVAQGGADRNGANASNFAFVAGKTNLLALDASGNLMIGDDTSNATAVGAGRLWTVSATALAGITGGSSVAGTNLQAIFNVLRGPWIVDLITPSGVSTSFVPTFNADGTFTATLTPLSPSGPVTTDAGTWQLTPPDVLQPFSNAQGHLTFTDSQGVVLFSNDILLERVDMFASETMGTGSLGAPVAATWLKFAP
jgi:hypothetical protein